MSSPTASLFASVALAVIGAALLAYSLTHPGLLTSLANRVLVDTSEHETLNSSHSGRTVLAAQDEPVDAPGTVAIRAGDYGHFETEAEINGRPIDVMVDTGASLVALTYEDAARVGIFVKPSDFTNIAQTANGPARVAPVTISRISIGDITVRNIPAVISERGVSGRTLLGMSFLGRLSRVEMRAGTLLLEE